MADIFNTTLGSYKSEFIAALKESFSDAEFYIFISNINNPKLKIGIDILECVPIRYDLYLAGLFKDSGLAPLFKSFEKWVFDNFNQNKPCFLHFYERIKQICDFENLDISLSKLPVFENILSEGKFPLLDRNKFRENLFDVLSSKDSNVVFIKGVSGSGMSYLKYLFQNICKKLEIFNYYEFDCNRYFNGKLLNQGIIIANVLAEEFSLNFRYDDISIEKVKFVRFKTLLREKISLKCNIPIIFLHDFHHYQDTLSEDVNEFIYELTESILSEFPKTIIIFAGYDYNVLYNWQDDLQWRCLTYSMESVDDSDINRFCENVYIKYSKNIEQSKTDFCNEFSNYLIKANDLNLRELCSAARNVINEIQKVSM